MGKKKGFNNYKIIDENNTEFYVTKKDGTEVTFLIDTEDLQKLINLNYSWGAVWDEGVDNYYATSTHYYKDKNGNRKQESVLLTEIIMNYKPIDHINHDTKNNKKNNLRKTKHQTNARNRRGANKNNNSGYRNVCWDKNSNKWMIQLQVDGKNKVLGRFEENELDQAGQFAKDMRSKYYGEFAGRG